MRNMIKALKKKYALSDQGASDLFKGILYSVLANISLMLPVILLAVVLNQLLSPILGIADSEKSAAFYTITGIVILAVVFILHYLQYTAAYVGTYEESARRRIHLAEKLRTLPLGFFHQRDLSDLTSTIMGDCASFEHAFSHTVPQFWGAVISTGIVSDESGIFDGVIYRLWGYDKKDVPYIKSSLNRDSEIGRASCRERVFRAV